MFKLRSTTAGFALIGALKVLVAEPSAAQELHGMDCNLCRELAEGSASIAPAEGETDILAAYQSNLGAVTNCIDAQLLGNPRQFEPTGRWLSEVRTAIDGSVWRRSSVAGPASNCPDCLDDTERLTSLFRVLFGQRGLQADMLSVDEKALLSCRAIFTDLEGAAAVVDAAAR